MSANDEMLLYCVVGSNGDYLRNCEYGREASSAKFPKTARLFKNEKSAIKYVDEMITYAIEDRIRILACIDQNNTYAYDVISGNKPISYWASSIIEDFKAKNVEQQKYFKTQVLNHEKIIDKFKSYKVICCDLRILSSTDHTVNVP